MFLTLKATCSRRAHVMLTRFHLKDVVPEVLVGRKVRVFWPDDVLWYSGTISAYNEDTAKHTVSPNALGSA